MKTTFVFALLLTTLWAAHAVADAFPSNELIYNPKGNLPGRTIISFRDYEEIKIDSNLDGKIDFWHIKKSGLIVEVFFSSGNVKEFYVRKLYPKYVAEFQYSNRNDHLELVKARVRPHFQMGYSVCESDLKSLKTKLAAFGSNTESEISRALIKENLVDPACEEILGKDAFNRLLKSLEVKLSDRDSMGECLKRDGLKKNFSNTDPELAVSILRASYDLQKKQLSEQSQNHKPTVVCKNVDKTDEERGYKVARTDEWGTISIFNPTQSKPPIIGVPHLDHEFLHRIGLFDEATIHKIVSFCASDKNDMNKKSLDSEMSSEMSATMNLNQGNIAAGSKKSAQEQTADIAESVIENGAGTAKTAGQKKSGSEVAVNNGKSSVTAVVAKDSSANIPATMTVAQASIPSGDVLSTSIRDPQPLTDAGAQAAYKTSVSQSSGVLQTANNLAGSLSTRVEASAKSVSNTKEVASAAYAAESKSVLTGKAPTVGALTARNKIGANETIVESITIDDGNNAVATTGGNNSRLPANTGTVTNLRDTSSTSTAAKAKESPAETAGSGEGGFAQASANPERASLSGSSGGTGASIPRQPANIRRGTTTTTASSQSVTQDEVVTFISKSDYSATKRKLSEKSFTDQLVEQKITILDTYGNTYGAQKGDVIFLDRGNRFVRQK